MSGVAGTAQPDRILDTGISVVHDPQDPPPVVDVVIVHGLHGHPYKSWTAKAPTTELVSPASTFVPSADNPNESKSGWRRAIRRLGPIRQKGTASECKTGSRSTTSTSFDGGPAPDELVFWPADLLPSKCPRARILTFGYDSKVTKYTSGATNKGTLAAHSKDLLFSLGRNRVPDRPIIFLAHSLGGIVVKEMLERSTTATESKLNNIVESTAAVIFFGTPHRGSPDLAAMGEYLRSIVSGLRMQTTSAILDSLGLKTTDLERAQEAFSRIWRQYDFRVKTFQEGLGMSGVNLGVLANKVVPDYSSSIGDHREHCETLQANHKNLCRFAGENDANWRKVSGELCSIYHSILDLSTQDVRPRRHNQRTLNSSGSPSRTVSSSAKEKILSDDEKVSLKSLSFPSMYTRLRRIEKPAEETCCWLFEHETYQNWFGGRSRGGGHGLLWLKGKPGTGKSTLMKEAYNRTVQGQVDGDYDTAAFFFSAKDSDLEHSPSGLWRSWLHQLLPNWPESLKTFRKRWATRLQEGEQPWEEAELKEMFQDAFYNSPEGQVRRTFIFIDAIDECDGARLREQVYFWRDMTNLACSHRLSLKVCISSRHFPHISLSRCPEIIVENHNYLDIKKYVDQRFGLSVGVNDLQWKILQHRVMSRAMGVFMWVVLVVDDLLRNWDDGKDIRYLIKRLEVVPDALDSLFTQMLASVSQKDRLLTTRLFQWAILSTKPLRVHEWHHVLAFIRDPVPKSLSEWRTSDYFTQTDSQLERQIRSISKGLIEIRSTPAEDAIDQALELLSIRAGAGSLNLELGETRTVSVIHESVRDLFLHSGGFETLMPSLGLQPVGNGHLSIMETCLDYLGIEELDALAEARSSFKKRGSGRLVQATSTFSLSGSYSDAVLQEKTGAGLVPGVAGPLQLSLDLPTDSRIEQGIDVARWINANEDASSMKSLTSLNGLPNQPVSRSPVSCRSRVLEDYPSLLSYATYEFFSHARLAQDDAVLPDSITSRLIGRGGWERLSALREDIPGEMGPVSYAIQAHGLVSWQFPRSLNPDLSPTNLGVADVRQDGQLGGASQSPHHLGRAEEKTATKEQPLTHVVEGFNPEPVRVAKSTTIGELKEQRGKVKLTRGHMSGRRSVASFSSASSHTGSVNLTYTGKSNGVIGAGTDQSILSASDANMVTDLGLGGKGLIMGPPYLQTKPSDQTISSDSDYIDESAIDDDDDCSDWEDSLEDGDGDDSQTNILALSQLAITQAQPAVGEPDNSLRDAASRSVPAISDSVESVSWVSPAPRPDASNEAPRMIKSMRQPFLAETRKSSVNAPYLSRSM